ncbi:ribonuclease P protein component 1 [Halocatena halophila]|uniref:ribonuclease P protein component 1 n=1 Tax=Halocatena halophila TaxID=2814576 RepID=UPI002ED3E842
MITPETIARHELVGLHVQVTESTDPTLVGCHGPVVNETTNTLVVRDGSRTRQVPKAIATFAFCLPETDSTVFVDGERLIARPARRTERTGGSQWQ